MFYYSLLFPYTFVFMGLILFYHGELFEIFSIPTFLVKIGAILCFILSGLFVMMIPLVSCLYYPYAVLLNNKKIVIRYRFHDKTIDMNFDAYMEQIIIRDKNLYLMKGVNVMEELTNIDKEILERIIDCYFDKSQAISIEDFNKMKNQRKIKKQ